MIKKLFALVVGGVVLALLALLSWAIWLGLSDYYEWSNANLARAGCIRLADQHSSVRSLRSPEEGYFYWVRKDPWGECYKIYFCESAISEKIIVKSFGPDCIEGTLDDIVEEREFYSFKSLIKNSEAISENISRGIAKGLK